jgi:hypothetical protein
MSMEIFMHAANKLNKERKHTQVARKHTFDKSGFSIRTSHGSKGPQTRQNCLNSARDADQRLKDPTNSNSAKGDGERQQVWVDQILGSADPVLPPLISSCHVSSPRAFAMSITQVWCMFTGHKPPLQAYKYKGVPLN